MMPPSTSGHHHGSKVKELVPELFVVVSHHARKTQTVAAGLPNHAWIHDITGALMILVLV
jgi:hypothetical protein